jgi:WD40 repeat protein
MLAEAPMQLYSAGLLFSPSYSIFRKAFSSEASTDLEVIAQLPSEWNACTYTLEGHSSGVSGVVFSHDGSRIASGSWDKTVRVWDVASWKEILCYDAGTDQQYIEFSHDS